MLTDLHKRFFGRAPTTVAQSVIDEETDNDCFTLSQQQNTDTGDYTFVECSQVNDQFAHCKRRPGKELR